MDKDRKIKISLVADTSHLQPGQLSALADLKQAVQLVTDIYLRQVPKPGQPAFYPPALTKENFEKYLEAHPAERPALESHFTLVQSNPKGDLAAVPYCQTYAKELGKLAKCLKTAAQKISRNNGSANGSANKELADFLNSRADALLTDKFESSEVQWIKLGPDAPLELTIGPYEEYDDLLWGTKRSYEALLGVPVKDENDKLNQFISWAAEFDAELGRKYNYSPNSSQRTMVVIDEVAAGGYSRLGFIPMAYNLPNDTDIKLKAGSKQVFMRNVIYSKFSAITEKIARQISAQPEILKLFSPQAYLLSIVGHELAHGLGVYCKNGLRELGHGLEESKADVYGILFLYYLADRGLLSLEQAHAAAAIKTIDGLRQVRFGQEEAHAIGAVIQFRWMLDCGAIVISNGKIFIDLKKLRTGQEKLGQAFAEVAFSESYKKARDFISVWAAKIPELQTLTAQFEHLPVDIEPVFS